MKTYYIRLIIVLTLTMVGFAINGQAYFKTSNATDLLEQKVAEFSNGDLLIGNSSTEPLKSGNEDGVLIFSRVDYCGNIIWLRKYNYNGGYLVLKDIAVNQNDDMFLYGSHYKGLAESIFIAKIEETVSSDLDIRIVSPGSVDHFTYSIDVRNNILLVYGLTFDFNSSKEGFIGIYDHNLNFIRANKFVPFESSGNAIVSDNEEIIGRSGPYIYKFNQGGGIDWAFLTIEDANVQNVSGPFSDNNGWIYEAHINGTSFLYHIDGDGNIDWKSDMVTASNVGGYLSELNNGSLLFVYNRETSTGSELCFLILDQSGTTLAERKLVVPNTMNNGTLFQRVRDADINVIGSKNLFAAGNVEIENFIVQFTLDDEAGDCYSFENFTNTSANNVTIILEPLEDLLDVGLTEFALETTDRIMLRTINETSRLNDLCSLGEEIIPDVETKVLPCLDAWEITLPTSDFIWDDGYPTLNRSLSQPGTYTARNIDCMAQKILEYTLEKEDCGCSIYLPNVFTPNVGSVNDKLELGIFCDLESFNVSIYSRWGERIFTSNRQDRFWEGKINERDAPAGIYSAIVNYSWLDESGVEQQEKIIKTVTLLR